VEVSAVLDQRAGQEPARPGQPRDQRGAPGPELGCPGPGQILVLV
jgi:hypothetical protein